VETKELIKKVRKIEIKSRGLSRNIFAGQYHSAFKGRGMTFSEVREYQPGDDIRSIDWNVTARFNHPYVKIYEEERELTVMLLVDVSGSRDFGTRGMLKKNMITEIAAVLSFSAIQNNDKIGVIFFSNKVEKFIPPQKGRKHILLIIRELIDFIPENRTTDLTEPLRFLTNAIKKKSTVFMISDFLQSHDPLNGDKDTRARIFADTLKIAARKHDMVGIRIYDERETDLPAVGMLRVSDAETGRLMWVDTLSENVRSRYSSWWKTHDSKLNELFLKNGIDAVSVSTAGDYVKPLIKLFKRR
jgi:uncharacterized protein (DUF58 family)